LVIAGCLLKLFNMKDQSCLSKNLEDKCSKVCRTK
jgi:hypothetical protein